jgi:protein-tyrosine phosphatase
MPTEILPRLWIGDMVDAGNMTLINDLNITTVINCTPDVPFVNAYLNNMRLVVNDNGAPDQIKLLYENMNRFADKIHLALSNNGTVLVHCHAGRQRSCAIVAGYLMKYGGVGPADAVRYIRSKRSIAFFPEVNFRPALVEFWQDLQGNKLI